MRERSDDCLTGLRPVELVDVKEVDRRHAREVLAGLGVPPRPYTPEIDDGMMDEDLRRLVVSARTRTAACRDGVRSIPDAASNRLMGEGMLKRDEGLRRRAEELDKVLRAREGSHS